MVQDSDVVKAKASTHEAKAKARTVEAKTKAKDTKFCPRGQGLGLRTTSLCKTML